MTNYINILIIDKDPKIRIGLKEILSGGGNNVILQSSFDESKKIIHQKEIGIILVNINTSKDIVYQIKKIKERKLFRNNYIIVITDENSTGPVLIKEIKHGAVDFITFPFNPNLVRSKVGVYKALYQKNQKVSKLLANILPETILEELSSSGKYTPKKVDKGVVIFTDFVDFSANSKKMKPLELIVKLESYFTKFDEIVEKYHLEKIKTIGDAYMATAGVIENTPNPAIRASLAALEMREYVQNKRDVAIALKKDFWEIRIGIHQGPLVAGIIGSSKYSFDVWGDSVNIASRAESASKPGKITITESIYSEIQNYFNTEPRGKIDIKKRGGSVDMYYLNNIQTDFSLYSSGKVANKNLRIICGLPPVEFDHMRRDLLKLLNSLLPESLRYHDINHTLNVEKSAMQYAKLEGLSDEDALLLNTAVLFHDSGFIICYNQNEEFGAKIAENTLPKYGYTKEQIQVVKNIILATKHNIEPKTLLEKIMCDSDHDYLGRSDYHFIAKNLRLEMETFGISMPDLEWLNYQLEFLENKHNYYTETVDNLRSKGKEIRIEELKKQLFN